MANPQEINAAVTARLTTELDFTFEKNKEELASQVRLEAVPQLASKLQQNFSVSIDQDGDIALSANDYYVYMRERGTTSLLSRVPLSMVTSSSEVSSLSIVVDELYKLRSRVVKPVAYGARLFCRFYSPDSVSVEKAKMSHIGALLHPDCEQLGNLSYSYSYRLGVFQDSIEFEVGAKEVSLRIIRDANADQFANFSDFWTKVNLPQMVSAAVPFFEQLEPSSTTQLGSFLTGRRKD